jgi:hypothetical protein
MTARIASYIISGVALLGTISPSAAQDSRWASGMFAKLEHDFGVVARGTDAKYRLQITNNNQQTVHIANVTTTCGCTAARPEQDTLASGESTFVEITMNTVKFEGHKPSSVTVIFDRPAHAEVRIPIHAFIRRDVVLTPGGARFGSVTRGTAAEQTVEIAYAGRGDWKIKDIISKNPNITTELVETRRDSTNVNYKLHLTLRDEASIGDFREQLTLVTDEQPNPYIPLLVEGRVEGAYTISPEVVSFGNLSPGQRKTVNVVIRGKQPFLVERIESEHSSGMFEVRLPKEAKPIHVVPLAIIAPQESGTVEEEFAVTISETSEKLTFRAHAKVIVPTTTAGRVAPGGRARGVVSRAGTP